MIAQFEQERPRLRAIAHRMLGSFAEADDALCFVTARAELEERIGALATAIHPDRMLWILWPKRASKVPTDMTEDVVRDVALPFGLVEERGIRIERLVDWGERGLARATTYFSGEIPALDPITTLTRLAGNDHW